MKNRYWSERIFINTKILIAKMNVRKNGYFIDEGYSNIATGRHNEEELVEMGCIKTATGNYLLLSSNQLRGIDLVFERKEDGRWGVTKENKKAIFNLSLSSEEFLDTLIEDVKIRGGIGPDLVEKLEELRELL